MQGFLQQIDPERQKKENDKMLKMIKENYDLMKRYIDEVNIYSSDLYQKLQVKLNLKAD